MNFATLPNLVALAVLVVVFWAISRKATTEQVGLWLVGWALVLLHFAAQFPVFSSTAWIRLATALSFDSLILAGVAFLISVSFDVSRSRRRWVLLAAAIAFPTLAYTNGLIWDIANPNYYYFLTVIGTLAPLLVFLRYHEHGKVYAAGSIVAAVAAAAVMVWRIARGEPEFGITLILASLNFSIAVLYWSHRRRVSAGVLTAVAGFAIWGAVFPAALLLQIFEPAVKVESAVWNIPKYLVAVGMILTLLEDQITKSTYLAYHDELTDLPNRRLLEDRLNQALAQVRRIGGKVAVFVLDLDHFKEVNDTFGHRVGDFALRQVVARLAARVRSSDTLARSGGDEFTIVSHVPSREAAVTLSSSLEAALREPIILEGTEVRIGASIGWALYPDAGSDADQICAAADRAMYAAKKAARNSGPVTALRPSVTQV